MKRAKANNGSAVRVPARPASGSSLTADKKAADASRATSHLEPNTPRTPAAGPANTPKRMRAGARDQEPVASGNQPPEAESSRKTDERASARRQQYCDPQLEEFDKEYRKAMANIAAISEEALGPVVAPHILRLAASLPHYDGDNSKRSRLEHTGQAAVNFICAMFMHVGAKAAKRRLEEEEEEEDEEDELDYDESTTEGESEGVSDGGLEEEDCAGDSARAEANQKLMRNVKDPSMIVVVLDDGNDCIGGILSRFTVLWLNCYSTQCL
ncbi:uncharacterized protein PG998_012987 [Apiospora kogelbergensis]|uniref:uncharacterized protein n=1 Tax=Apiospora kogelbergensis TaxID=1337665 RepID=UPI00312FB204